MGPVSVCVDRPLLSLDRPFTYELSADVDAGLGSLVQVPFHGTRVKGWILGPTDDVPRRMLRVTKAISPTRWFDERGLALARWVSARYVAPLATVLDRVTPPRVAGEEGPERLAVPSAVAAPDAGVPAPIDAYRHGREILGSIGVAPGAWVLRPAPEDEAAATVQIVASCLAGGRRALVVVPEASPVPATASALAETFGDRVASLVGGSSRARYRTWLDVQAGAYDVVVGTRPSVFAPVPDLGAIVVSRESHLAHREDRAPYFHVRDVAVARGRLDGVTVALSALAPSSEAAALGLTTVRPPRRSWVPVEVVAPGPEGRAPRLVRALAQVSRAFVFSPMPGAGVAAVCRACSSPAACAACGGSLRASEGSVRCMVCEAGGRCRVCGASNFGIRRGGEEHVEEWAGRATTVPVHRLRDGERARLPRGREVLVGGADDVRDLGPAGLDLVAILDADLAARRPGLAAIERALTVWFEAVAWARPHGRAIVQSSRAGDPAIQSLVLGDPARFHRDEARRRAEAGFPVGAAVFRVAGTTELADELRALDPITLLTTSAAGQTICLVALDVRRVPAFGELARALAARDVVTRVEAEPHL